MVIHMNIGDIVTVNINLGKSTRKAICIITNKYTRNNKVYYAIREINGIYKCSNTTINRFL